MFLKISHISQENTCVAFRPQHFEKETLTQMFSCEICEISKNTYFEEHLGITACTIKITIFSFLWSARQLHLRYSNQAYSLTYLNFPIIQPYLYHYLIKLLI